MSAPTLIDLFAGCGEMTAGFAAAGFEPVAPLKAAIDTLVREMVQPVAGQRTDQNRNQTPGQAPSQNAGMVLEHTTGLVLEHTVQPEQCPIIAKGCDGHWHTTN